MRPKTNQREFSDHPARQDDSRKYCGALGEQVTAEYWVGSHQVSAADCEKQNQPGKEVAVKGCVLQPYVGKRHSISHESDAAGDGAKPIEIIRVLRPKGNEWR
jgi:hypothetical protein